VTVKKQKAHVDVLKKSIKALTAEIKKKAKEIELLDKDISEYDASTESVEAKQAKLAADLEELEVHLTAATKRLEDISLQVRTSHTWHFPSRSESCQTRRLLQYTGVVF
jgi:chromosome segregation ATPase